MYKLVPLFLALSTVPAPAVAQQASPFSGFRLEAVAGLDVQRHRLEGKSDSGTGLLYGVQAGYDAAVGDVLLGVEAEITDSSSQTVVNGVLTPPGLYQVSADRDLFVGARIGVGLSGTTIIYAKGGYTNARFASSFVNATGQDFSGSSNEGGFRLGAGGELIVSGPIYVKAEYRFSNYGNSVSRLQKHQGLAGLGIRF